MSNYSSNTMSGSYQGVPQNYAQQLQQHQYSQSSPSRKAGGTFGQMMSQAVSTGKPMVDKLGQRLSSKLGNKPAPGPPQQLQSYQNYQGHQNAQGHGHGYQPQNQTYSPQPQWQQWEQTEQQQQQLTPSVTSYTPAQPSPYQANYYGAPAPAPTSQSNYFPQQSPPSSNHSPNSPLHLPPVQAPASQQPLSAPEYKTSEYGQGQLGHTNTAQSQEYSPQGQHNAYNGHQTSFTAGGQVGFQQQLGYPTPPPIPPRPTTSLPDSAVSPIQQQQWGYAQNHAPPIDQQQQSYPPVPSTPFQQEQQHQHQPQQPNLPPSNRPYQQEQSQQQEPHPMSPVSPEAQVANPISPPTSTPPPPPPTPPHNNAQGQRTPDPLAPTQSSTPAPQSSLPSAAPTKSVAELPTDFGHLRLDDSPIGTGAATPSSQTVSPSKRFSIPRRKVSDSSVPLADPWSIVDPVTETPTREFYILADLLFDVLDRNFEPRNSGLLEAPKIVESWVGLPEDARKIYSYNGYTALAHQWALESIPHVMIPVQPHLAPRWKFDQQAHAEELKIPEPPSFTSSFATYMPALNRAGWYKFFFLEFMQDPDEISKVIPVLCADTYKPGVLNHPDLAKMERPEVQALRARADEVQTLAIKRVGDEARTSMMLDPNIPVSSVVQTGGSSAASGTLEPGSPEDIAVRMHRLQAERQFNDMAVRTVLGAGIMFGPAGGYSGGYASLV